MNRNYSIRYIALVLLLSQLSPSTACLADSLLSFDEYIEHADYVALGNVSLDKTNNVSVEFSETSHHIYYYGVFYPMAIIPEYSERWRSDPIFPKSFKVLAREADAEQFVSMENQVWILRYNKIFRAYLIEHLDCKIYHDPKIESLQERINNETKKLD